MKIQPATSHWFGEQGVRLDASYHLSEARQAKLHIDRSPFKVEKLGNVTAAIFSGPRFKRYYVNNPEKGVPFLTGSDMQKADFSSLKWISKKLTKSIAELYVQKGWILITRSGTIGKTAYVREDFLGKTATEDVIRVVADSTKIMSGYLYSFLSSKIGYYLLTQSTYGGVIQHIEPHHIKDLPIPLLPEAEQADIHAMIEEAAQLRVEANRLLETSLNLFNQKYKIDEKKNLAFIKRSDKLRFSWTGRNNDKVAELILSEITQEDYFILSDKTDKVFAPPLFKHIYLEKDNGHPFYTGAHLSSSFRRSERYLSPRGVGRIEDYKVQTGTLVVYKSGPRDGMLGQTFLVDKSLNQGCLSDHVIRIQIEDEMLRFWVFAFLKSKPGLRVLHNIATGSAILFITPNRIGDLPIPTPTIEQLHENHKTISEYIDLFGKAHELETAAIAQVEAWIKAW